MIDTEYWTEHHYAGHIFLIKSDEPPSKWDGYCQYILQYRTIFGTSWSPDTVEAVQPPTDAVRFANIALSGDKSRTPPKPKIKSNDSTPRVRKRKPLEAVRSALEETQANQEGGNKCRTCGNEIERTGKRGRPRVRHSECVGS